MTIDRCAMRPLLGALCLLIALNIVTMHVSPPQSIVRGLANVGTHSSSGVTLLRTIAVPAHSIALAVDAPAGRVVVLSQGPRNTTKGDAPTGHASVSILDATTGRLLRTTTLGPASYIGEPFYANNSPPLDSEQGIASSLVVDEYTGHVFVLQLDASIPSSTEIGIAPTSGRIRILDVMTGRIIRTVSADKTPLGLIVDTRSGRLFVPSMSPSIRMFSTTTGALARVIPATPAVHQGAPMVDARRGHVLVKGMIRPRPGRDGVIVIDATTGRVIRVVQLSTPSACGPSLVFDEGTNHLIAAIGEPRVAMRAQVLDGATGQVLRDEALPTVDGAGGNCPIVLAADASTSRAFVYEAPAYTGGTSDVGVLDTRDGRIVSTIPTGFGESTSISLAIDHRTGRAFVVDTNTPDVTTTFDKLTVLDTRSGRVLQTMTLGQGPPVVAVDERTKRVFVVNGADSTVSVLDASHA